MLLTVTRPNDERQNRALHGLERALLANMVTGVSTGFERSLQIEGVGYGSELRGADLVMQLGLLARNRREPAAEHHLRDRRSWAS